MRVYLVETFMSSCKKGSGMTALDYNELADRVQKAPEDFMQKFKRLRIKLPPELRSSFGSRMVQGGIRE